ncbi:hypothetical protein U1Q18_001137 [Sarracenia purpurea var. burkii]
MGGITEGSRDEKNMYNVVVPEKPIGDGNESINGNRFGEVTKITEEKRPVENKKAVMRSGGTKNQSVNAQKNREKEALKALMRGHGRTQDSKTREKCPHTAKGETMTTAPQGTTGQTGTIADTGDCRAPPGQNRAERAAKTNRIFLSSFAVNISSCCRNASTFLLLLCFLFFFYAAVNISAATPVAFEGCSLPLLPPYYHGALSCCFCLCWQWFLLNHVLVAVLVCMAWCLVSKLLLLVWAISCAAADKACAAVNCCLMLCSKV